MLVTTGVVWEATICKRNMDSFYRPGPGYKVLDFNAPKKPKLVPLMELKLETEAIGHLGKYLEIWKVLNSSKK